MYVYIYIYIYIYIWQLCTLCPPTPHPTTGWGLGCFRGSPPPIFGVGSSKKWVSERIETQGEGIEAYEVVGRAKNRV